MKNPEIAKKAGIKPDTWQTWNKGLTYDSDDRVKNYTRKRNKNLIEIGEKISKTKKERYKTCQIKSCWKGKYRGEENIEERNLKKK